MTSWTSWSVIEAASQLLPLKDREAVLGDLAETNQSLRQMLAQLFGLAVRRHLALWNSWQPWLAALGLALPTSFLLMGASISISSTVQQMLSHPVPAHHALRTLISPGLLLISWSWTAGLVVSFLSRRTLWISGISCLIPCLFCLSRFHMESLPRLSLFVFLLPALLGVWQGIRAMPIGLSFAVMMAVAVTTLVILTSSREFWLCNTALLWPAWYLVAVALGKAAKKEERLTA
jgi:hypothetical protein